MQRLTALFVALLFASAAHAASPGSRARAKAAWDSIPERMTAKGLLPSDLTEATQAELLVVVKAMGAEDWAAVVKGTEQFLASVDRIVIDVAFTQAKMARVNRMHRSLQAPLDAAAKKQLISLLDLFSEDFSDGNYERANQRLNAMHQLLEKVREAQEKAAASVADERE